MSHFWVAGDESMMMFKQKLDLKSQNYFNKGFYLVKASGCGSSSFLKIVFSVDTKGLKSYVLEFMLK